MRENIMKPQEILDKTREYISDHTGGDLDKWFYANRFVYARLQLDERKTKTAVKKQLFENNPTCPYCKESIENKRGIHLHRLDGDKGYSLENCALMHPDCHTKYHAENPSGKHSERPSSQKASGRIAPILEKVMKGQRGRKSTNVIRIPKGLLSDATWRHTLQNHPTSLIGLIRKRLLKKIPGLTEKFNRQLRYFGYWSGNDKDRVYIYIQKKKLVIDLCISPDFTAALNNQGFKVKPRDNFQGKRGWLTGWQVPHSTTDADRIVKWLCKAFEEKL